jgi:hypothetical protein
LEDFMNTLPQDAESAGDGGYHVTV